MVSYNCLKYKRTHKRTQPVRFIAKNYITTINMRRWSLSNNVSRT